MALTVVAKATETNATTRTPAIGEVDPPTRLDQTKVEELE
jgi:hypothetical protein